MVKLELIPLPTKHFTGYLKFFIIIILTIWTYPAVPDAITHVLYVLVDDEDVPKEIFHSEVGFIIENIIIVWLILWVIKKSAEIYNDILMYATRNKVKEPT